MLHFYREVFGVILFQPKIYLIIVLSKELLAFLLFSKYLSMKSGSSNVLNSPIFSSDELSLADSVQLSCVLTNLVWMFSVLSQSESLEMVTSAFGNSIH